MARVGPQRHRKYIYIYIYIYVCVCVCVCIILGLCLLFEDIIKGTVQSVQTDRFAPPDSLFSAYGVQSDRNMKLSTASI